MKRLLLILFLGFNSIVHGQTASFESESQFVLKYLSRYENLSYSLVRGRVFRHGKVVKAQMVNDSSKQQPIVLVHRVFNRASLLEELRYKAGHLRITVVKRDGKLLTVKIKDNWDRKRPTYFLMVDKYVKTRKGTFFNKSTE
ncbi:MAG: hypothetical protein JSU09_01655 [Bacteroidetes bacterium]|nr:hypothetical protein [Bacteroidota bacterium]